MNTENISDHIIEGIRKRKGKEIVSLDLTNIDTSICQNFIICHGDSNRQVSAIAESIEDEVNTQLNIKAFHKEGLENSEWVLLDYLDVIVHIFQQNVRQHYRLEELWGDGELTQIESE